MMSVQENKAEEVLCVLDEIRRGGPTKGRLEMSMSNRAYIVSEKRALEIAAWARIVGGALKREADSAFWAGEIERATSFLPLIAYTEQLVETSA